MTHLLTPCFSPLLAAAAGAAAGDPSAADSGHPVAVLAIKTGLAAVAALGVLVAALTGDLSQFRFRRVWAIAGVCFRESVRRRVLWITPLAIVGIVAVSQLTRPADEQDAVRQTI